MQKVYVRKGKAATCDLKKDIEIMHFSLQDALPPGHILALNTKFGTLSYLSYDGDRLQMMVQEQFTSTELSVLLPLLEMFPYYCPYATLHASFCYGRTTEKAVEKSQRRLLEAADEGVWDQEMRPLRNCISRARIKFRTFGVEITSILETGYMLVAIPELKETPS